MATYSIENEKIKATINSYGAELRGIIKKDDASEIMWSGDSAFWGRVSPVLFPFVGRLEDQTYRYDGREFSGIPQHGYARDTEFTLVEQKDNEIWFSMKPDNMWLEKYPFVFEFRAGYKLEGCKLHVMWTVINNDKKMMYFSIGAHPAFICENGANTEDRLEGYTMNLYNNAASVSSGVIDDMGLMSDKTKDIPLENGVLKLCGSLFDEDALVIDSKGVNTVSIIDPSGKEFVKVHFDTPQLGIWSPVGKNAPFVCIEPWYGRCDRSGFTGELSEREYGNSLEPGHSFNKEYVIEVC